MDDDSLTYPHATYARAVERYGLQKFADDLGESVNSVCNWRVRGVPANRALAVSKMLGVSVRTLRPNDWRDYWPPMPRRSRSESPDTPPPPNEPDTPIAA